MSSQVCERILQKTQMKASTRIRLSIKLNQSAIRVQQQNQQVKQKGV